jgi:hypothetical protein
MAKWWKLGILSASRTDSSVASLTRPTGFPACGWPTFIERTTSKMPVGRDSLEGYLPFASPLTQSGAENSEMSILGKNH